MSAVRSNPAPSNTRRSCKKPAVVWRPVWAQVRVKRPVSSHTYVNAQNAAVQGNSREHTQSCHILPGATQLTNRATYCYGTEGYKWTSAMTAVTGTDKGQTQGTQRHSNQYPGRGQPPGEPTAGPAWSERLRGQEGLEAFGAQGPVQAGRKTLLRRKTSAGLRANANPLKNCWATSAHTKTLRTRGLSPHLTHWKLRTPNCPLSLGDENPEVVRSTRRKHETARRPEGYDFVVTS